MTCEEVRLSLGAHALGALDADEAVVVEAHLAACAECRAEFHDLVGVSTFLGRVSAADVAHAAAPPRAVLDRMLVAGGRRRRRSRVLLAAAAAAVVVAGGGAVATAVMNGSASDGRSASVAAPLSAAEDSATAAREQDEPAEPKMAPSSRASRSAANAQEKENTTAVAQAPDITRFAKDGPVSATVQVFAVEGGSEIKIDLRGVASGTSCRLVVVGVDATRNTAANWKVAEPQADEVNGYEAASPPTGTTSFSPGQIDRFEVVGDDGGVLLTVETP
ncbi:zf-HC2 domain-containing protein [Spongiactinospora sp. TRM90649]|uniref:anti-sigma factor family protein n=1 Tax=Spongiactinospora sp. TRM90649 TaxID=3031114 RepID=UPI0023F834D6|nr:zf-HC2 domain-containing protein [Spongiactinospora sp. TRM90649]MDF5751786.1 zf-HC2 domain-containing protein [Spongiactinospora sp. TRM90649]